MYNYIIIFRCSQSFLIDVYVFGTMPDFALIPVGICHLFLISKTKHRQLLTKDKAWRYIAKIDIVSINEKKILIGQSLKFLENT